MLLVASLFFFDTFFFLCRYRLCFRRCSQTNTILNYSSIMCFLLHSILLWFICLAFYFDCFICWHRCCWSGELYRERMEKERRERKKCGKTLSVALFFVVVVEISLVCECARNHLANISVLWKKRGRENKVRYEPNLKNKWTNDRDVQNECAYNTRRMEQNPEIQWPMRREKLYCPPILSIYRSQHHSVTPIVTFYCHAFDKLI